MQGADGDQSVEEKLENALDTAEDDTARYWIRGALQDLVVDAEFEANSE